MAEEGQAEEEVKPDPIPPLQDEQVQERQQLWNEIFADYPTNKLKLASLEERKANEKEGEMSLTYGELDFTIVNNVITMLKNQHTRLYAGKGIFLDLGSGCGKACVAAGLIHPFQKVIGIETMACLDEAAQKVNEKYKEVVLPAPADPAADPPQPLPEIQFIKGDFVVDLIATLGEEQVSQIAVCLAVATCYGEEQLNALAMLADKMADNAIFVTFSQVLPDWVIGGDKKLPRERFRDQLKVTLAKRGTDPDAVEIDPSPADEKPGGWRLIHEEDVSLPNGKAPHDLPTKCFVFKRIPLPVTEQAQEGEEEAAQEA